jgi:U3 small nucleolar RNA-associated protein 12
MVKAYLRYEPTASFGVLSNGANPVYDPAGRLLITGALESVLVWNAKQGTLVSAGISTWLAGPRGGPQEHDGA